MTIYPPAYPSLIDVQIYVDPSWVSVGAYVIGDIEADWGISGNKPSDRMGYIGGMSLTLNNGTGLFLPGTTGAMAGFQRGAKIRCVITYEDSVYVRFKGKITKISLPYVVDSISMVDVKAADWFMVASKQNIIEQGIEANITTAEAAAILLTNMDTQPDATEITDGGEELDSVFNSSGAKSTVFSELSKLAASEFSYIYLKKDRAHGETLVVENRQGRIGKALAVFSVPAAYRDTLALSDGTAFLLSDGDNLALDQTASMTFDNMYGAEIEYGENLINELTVRQNPSRTDVSINTLYSLDAPIFIAAGQTISDFKVSYKNPTGGSGRINGANMIAPDPGTDYKMYANENGTGTNLTANLTFTVAYGAAGAVYKSMTNTSATNGWVTTLQARGYAVFVDQPYEYVLSDAASIEANELSPYTLNMQYQSDPTIVETIADTVFEQNRDNKIAPKKIKLCANISPYVLLAFLQGDVGDLIHVEEDVHEIDDNYFIQSVKFAASVGGTIMFDWGLVDASLASAIYWELETSGKSELEQTTIVSY